MVREQAMSVVSEPYLLLVTTRYILLLCKNLGVSRNVSNVLHMYLLASVTSRSTPAVVSAAVAIVEGLHLPVGEKYRKQLYVRVKMPNSNARDILVARFEVEDWTGIVSLSDGLGSLGVFFFVDILEAWWGIWGVICR